MIEVRNRNCVVAVENSQTKMMLARAVRVSKNHDWEVEFDSPNGPMLVAIIKAGIPELMQRKMIMALLEVLD